MFKARSARELLSLYDADPIPCEPSQKTVEAVVILPPHFSTSSIRNVAPGDRHVGDYSHRHAAKA
jgi:hypothetical protein